MTGTSGSEKLVKPVHFWSAPGLCPGSSSLRHLPSSLLLVIFSINPTLISTAMWKQQKLTPPPPTFSEIKFLFTSNFLQLTSDKTEFLLIGTKSTQSKVDSFHSPLIARQSPLPLRSRVWVSSPAVQYNFTHQ